MTKIFAQIPFTSATREASQDLVLTLNAETRQILDYCSLSSDSVGYKVNKEHISLKKQALQYEIRSDLVDTEIAVCSKALFTHLADDPELRSFKDDFVVQLVSSELTDDQLQASVLANGCYYARVNDPRTYQVIQQEIIQRRCAPFVVDFPVFSESY